MRLGVLLIGLLVALGSGAQQVGLVLSGGGAVGLTHIGVMKALEENDIPIDYIAGSSMGALVGAMYAAGYSPWEMDSLFSTERFRLMADGGLEDEYIFYFKQDIPDASLINLKFDLDTSLQASLPTNLRSPVLIDYEQLQMFAGASAVSGSDMDSLFVPYRCVASDITAQRPVMFDRGDLAQAVRASMSYPFYFKPIRIEGHLMMDGGLYNNFPSDVMYGEFLPDIILGSNVAYNAPPPSEDDLMSQLKAMLQEKTNYSVICENGIIVEPKTTTTLFDFSNAQQPILDGYNAAMERMPEIKAAIARRVPRAELEARRKHFRSKMPPTVFGDIHVQGLSRSQTVFAEHLLNKREEPIDAKTLKPRYFRLYADHAVSGLHPKATYREERGNYDLELLVKREKKLHVRFGGMFSSRPINTGMVGLRYNLFGRTSSRIEALSYFGKFYTAGQLKVRSDLSTRLPIYLEPTFTLQRTDYFSSFSTFFEEVRPGYVVMRETWGGLNTGMALGNKGLLRLDGKYAQTKDSYYQSLDFSPIDTADVTEFYFGTVGIMAERNSLNRKQHPNAGEQLSAELRYVGGDERTTPGSTSENTGVYNHHHEWVTAKVKLTSTSFPRGTVRFGMLLEGVYSTQTCFQNYTATVVRAPAFQPTPESKTFFINEFRAPQYLAGGVRTIIAVARNKFDLRLEAHVFQPYKPLLRGDFDNTVQGDPISERYYIASGSLIYQSPVGPVWFNTSYFDGLDEPWAWSLNFGYVLFAQKAME
ncbi:MAG: patatin-like phospholipase family protein [Flavobacteriales bacterium]|nr:patatin-like phospholipase family protein [Flavobacteriales bacterium]